MSDDKNRVNYVQVVSLDSDMLKNNQTQVPRQEGLVELAAAGHNVIYGTVEERDAIIKRMREGTEKLAQGARYTPSVPLYDLGPSFGPNPYPDSCCPSPKIHFPNQFDWSALKVPAVEKQRSTMFLTDLTVLDHGFIDDQGRIIGGSFHPSFEVTGEIDAAEKVVVDFSTIKKELKQHIDSKETGFDHKLWLIEGFSNITEERIVGHKKDRILIKTPALSFELPLSAIKRIPLIEGKVPSHETEYIGAALDVYLNDIYKRDRKATNITVRCVNRTLAHSFNPDTQKYSSTGPQYFTYAHGLKDSTSWGCQNIGHGHLSYLILGVSDELDQQFFAVEQLAYEIQEFLDGAYLINQENVVHDTKKYITLSYESMTRGIFTGVLNKELNKVHVLPTETTIELIVDYVVEIFGEDLKNAGVAYIMISEGLSKGAMKYL